TASSFVTRTVAYPVFVNDSVTCIGAAIDKPVRYHNVNPEDHRRAMLAAGLPPFMVEALDEQAAERRRHPESLVELNTHALFGVKPTTFAEFAQRCAAAFGGEALAKQAS